jgi:signal transduction histidine kinase
MEIKKNPINLNSFLYDLKDEYMWTANSSHIWIIIESDLPDDTYISSDYKILNQVFDNILTNAFKFTPPQWEIKIICKKVSEWIEIWVLDTWIWIKESDFSKVFSRFWQVSSPLNRTNSGSWLWLPLAKDMVASLWYGQLNLKSEIWKWSYFRFIIPDIPKI